MHETNENFDSCMQAVTMQVFPEGAYRRQKRYMRRNMRKPRALKIREVANDVAEMSEDFQYFPPEFSKSQILDDDEQADIVEGLSPSSWQNWLRLQGFDIADHSLDELVDMLERIETVEDIGTAVKSPPNETNSRPRAKVDAKRGYPNKGEYHPAKSAAADSSRFQKRKRDVWNRQWCPLHKVSTHDISDCKVVLAQIDKMNANWETNKKPYQKRQKMTRHMEAKQSRPRSNGDDEVYTLAAKILKDKRHQKKAHAKKGNLKRDSDYEYGSDGTSGELHAFDHLSVKDKQDDDNDWEDVSKEYDCDASDDSDEEFSA